MGWEETHLKGWGLKAMMSELTQIFLLIQGGVGRDFFKGVVI